jgi:hypothetical protein
VRGSCHRGLCQILGQLALVLPPHVISMCCATSDDRGSAAKPHCCRLMVPHDCTFDGATPLQIDGVAPLQTVGTIAEN